MNNFYSVIVDIPTPSTQQKPITTTTVSISEITEKGIYMIIVMFYINLRNTSLRKRKTSWQIKRFQRFGC